MTIPMYLWVQVHYGMLDQHIGTTSWTIILYQLVGSTFHSNFGVGVNSAIVDSFVCPISWYYMFVQLVVPTCCTNLLDQHVGPTFHTNFGVGVNSAT